MINQDIKAAQAEYAARPWVVYLDTRFYSGAHRFHTETEALRYIFDQSAKADSRDWRADIHGPRRTDIFDIIDVR